MNAESGHHSLLMAVTVEPAISHANLWKITDPRAYMVTKRCFDVVFAFLLLLALAPIWLVISVLIRLTSTGPTIYRQIRCGRYGREFTFYKFRTMVNGADAWQDELWSQNEMTGPVFKIRRDPRITPLGRWLRKTSVDELPQLLNVLRGEMSIVGPRPPLPCELSSYGEIEWMRLAVQPGLTCLWQVMGRSTLSFEQWIALDMEYLERRGFWFDLLIVLKTVPAVLLARGAF